MPDKPFTSRSCIQAVLRGLNPARIRALRARSARVAAMSGPYTAAFCQWLDSRGQWADNGPHDYQIPGRRPLRQFREGPAVRARAALPRLDLHVASGRTDPG